MITVDCFSSADEAVVGKDVPKMTMRAVPPSKDVVLEISAPLSFITIRLSPDSADEVAGALSAMASIIRLRAAAALGRKKG
jgi:hypothetical protein